ncbi:hypothetical protein C0991_005653 [Blastosporella zonata]|nr:hypothetical protein C0991_005653 [Blastosporella zonata]
MSTSAMIIHDDLTTLFPNIFEELVEPEPYITDEEFNAFILSVSPQATEFSNGICQDMNIAPENFIFPPNFEYNEEDMSFDPASMAVSPNTMTLSQFVVECGYDPSDFASLKLEPQSTDTDLWNIVLSEILDKMSEWAKTTNILIEEITQKIELQPSLAD